MTDRELLEKAAKAAGMVFTVEPQYFDYGRSDWGVYTYHANGVPWNPLNDDGDAFRLMVTLRLELYFAAFDVDVRGFIQVFAEKFGDDPAAATRRSIVRAAALMANEI